MPHTLTVMGTGWAVNDDLGRHAVKDNILEVLVGHSFGPRDADLADAARRWWKIDVTRRHDLEFIVARERWRDEPLAVFRITGSTVVDSGRVEFTVTEPSADEEREVLSAVDGRGVHYGAFRYGRT